MLQEVEGVRDPSSIGIIVLKFLAVWIISRLANGKKSKKKRYFNTCKNVSKRKGDFAGGVSSEGVKWLFKETLTMHSYEIKRS